MLLLFIATPVAAPHHSLRELLSPDRLFNAGQHLLLDVLPKILIIAVLAYILIRILAYFTDRMVKVAEKHAAAATRISQARTLSSVLRATGAGTIVFIAVLMILPLVGFNLGPLLASAGVAGVAIGLACQAVVKDCLNGTLFLLEDQFNVGDWITVAAITGQVEAMTLRKTTLRDGDGILYVIPNSQITTVANKTRDFSVATVNIDVDFSAHPDDVIKILTEVAMGVRNDPAFSDAFLADPAILGVDAIHGSQVVYPVVLRTKANQQWGAKREFQRRVRIALMEHNMLPGDPLRVYGQTAPATPGGPALLAASKAMPGAAPPAGVADINPFTGEGL
jgi:small-conductance mechanosensitive channel